RACARTQRHGFSNLEPVTGPIHSSFTHQHVSVRDQLSRCRDGACETKAKYGVVQAPFEQHQQIFSRVALERTRCIQIALHLSLGHTVIEPNLLLLFQPTPQRAWPATRWNGAMLTGRIRPAIGGFGREARELRPEPAKDSETRTTHWHDATCFRFVMCCSL